MEYSLKNQNIKLEKTKAMVSYKRRQRMTMLFRFIEFCIFLVIMSRFSTQFPFGFKLSTDYFKGVGVTLISPLFAFVLGNAIVIILFLKSGQSSAKVDSIKIDLYEQKCWVNKEVYCEQIEKQRKQSIHVEKAYCEQSKKQSILRQKQLAEKKLDRSHSDSFTSLSHDEKPRRELVRSATVGCLKDNIKSMEDEMSNEEFRTTVEAFIARQQRFLREEELLSAVVSEF
ncbi:hypothetical protein P3S68_009412 [Capsicum galapagoense]